VRGHHGGLAIQGQVHVGTFAPRAIELAPLLFSHLWNSALFMG